MGPMVWKVLGTGSAVLAATVAQKLVTKGWELASGKPAPDDPNHPEDTTWKEAVLFAALTGQAVSAARVMATRKAAQYYAKSAGHLPAALVKADGATG